MIVGVVPQRQAYKSVARQWQQAKQANSKRKMTGQVRAVTFHAHFPKVINTVAANKRQPGQDTLLVVRVDRRQTAVQSRQLADASAEGAQKAVGQQNEGHL